jgi:predicted PurR-regulated permease PerM
MTGRWREGSGGQQAATGSEPQADQPAGLRVRLRRLWRSGPATAPQAVPAAPGGATPTATVGDGTVGGGGVGTASGAVGSHDAPAAGPDSDTQVPRLLRATAAWSWRLLLTGLVIYLVFRVAVALRLVTLPFIAAMLLTALLQPLSAWLRRRGGFSPMLSTWCVFLLALVVIAGAITLLANQISSEYPVLFSELTKTANQVQHQLAGAPFHLSRTRLSKLSSDLLKYITQHKSVIAGTVLTGGKYAAEFLTGIILTLFISFFLLKDGAGIWKWLIHRMRPEANRRLTIAGDSAWRALVNYMRGTTVIAAIHAVLLGLALWLLGVPLLVPLIVLVFIAAFIPLIGILVVGGLAVLIALVTKGWVAAVILLAVLIVENQIEGHLLQPQIVGRIVKLHPLAIILVLAVGGIIAGIPGAIIAVPTAAAIVYAWPALRGDGDARPDGNGRPDG